MFTTTVSSRGYVGRFRSRSRSGKNRKTAKGYYLPLQCVGQRGVSGGVGEVGVDARHVLLMGVSKKQPTGSGCNPPWHRNGPCCPSAFPCDLEAALLQPV